MSAELVSSALGLALYLNTLGADFCYDDSRAIKTNQDLLPETPWTHIFYNDFWGTLLTHSGSHKSYRPLCTLSFRINHAIGGMDPWGYHLVNILLHAAVTGLFTNFSRILFGDGYWTLIAGLLFASHPIHTEAVAGIVGRADIGACLFFLLSLMCYVKHCSTRSSSARTWGWILGAGLCAGCSMLWKEQGVTVLAISAVYDIFVVHRLKMHQIIPALYKRKNLNLFFSIGLLTSWGTALLGVRLYWMGNKPPSFSNSDNPAADSDSFLTRMLTFLYLPTKNLWLLFCPDTLSFDWSMDAVPLLKAVSDWRNLHTVAFYAGLFLLAYFSLKGSSNERECNGKTVMNGKQNANGHSCHSEMEYKTLEGKSSFASKEENGIKKHEILKLQLPSTENIVILSLSLLIVPFIPATNLFFYVGFVIAERVLYVPSMGFCLLVTVGVRALYVKAQKRFLKNLVFCSTAALIVFYGLKTVVRNGDWQNEEMLYRSGIKVNPAKAWGNLGNVLKSQSKISEAESAYRNALYYRSNMADMLYNLGLLLQENNRFSEALHYYKLAIGSRPTLASAYLNTGIILMNQGKTEEARRTFLKCSEIPDENLKDPHAHKSRRAGERGERGGGRQTASVPPSVPQWGGLRPPRFLSVPPRLHWEVLPPPRPPRGHSRPPPFSGVAPPPPPQGPPGRSAAPQPLRLHTAHRQPPHRARRRSVRGDGPRPPPPRRLHHHSPRGAAAGRRRRRGSGGGGRGGGDDTEGGGRHRGGGGDFGPPPRVLAQNRPQLPGERNGFGPTAGFGYCFNSVTDGECSSPLPGLRTQHVCCRGGGAAWGVHECQPCNPGDAPAVEPCPKGFRRANGSCVDVDECREGGLCQNGVCSNSPGSFACLCHEGFILDSSRSSCISHQVLSEAKAPCFRVLRDGRCALPTLRNITRQICCCSRVGKAWGRDCLRCPPYGSEGFHEICPAGAGYHYSASDLRYNARPLGALLPRVPLSRPRATARPHGVSQRRPPQLPPSRPPPITRMSPPVTQLPPRVPEVPPRVLEVPPRVIEVPPRVLEVPPPGPEVVIVPRPTQGLQGPPPTPLPAGVCERNPQLCGPGRCVPRGGGYTCVCHNGFWLSTQGTHCIDVDECRRSPLPCSHGRCENTVGSFRCVCNAGYRPGSAGTDCHDVDECAQSPPPCAHGRCENLPGSFRCVCNAGFRSATHGGHCEDINECETPTACPGQECLNTPGSFQCRPCPDGFQLRHGRCADVDECSSAAPCGPRGRCTNTEGSFLCQCQRGYRAAAAGAPCEDVNECLEGDFCFPHGECLNADGSYRCLCAQGYAAAPDGTACRDVDECSRGDVCEGGRCVNTDGAFECHCPAGFRSDSARKRCTDVDECQEHGPRLCGAQRCQNIPGSFRCVPECPPGYRLRDSGECEDEDECSGPVPRCGAHAVCHNLPGSFQCACHQGYEAAPHGHHCQDVDECATLPGVCGAARCENVDGSFLCLCPTDGHEFDPVTGTCGGGVTQPPPPGVSSDPTMCYSPACGVLAANVSRQQCCCAVGWAWGPRCEQEAACPKDGTAEQRSLCPHGMGRSAAPHGPPGDVDECLMFAPHLCRGGVCINAAPGFSCYCPTGYYYEREHLQCVDNDECRDEGDLGPCVGGRCVNTVGSYYCVCSPPLVLDGAQRRCVPNDTRGHEDAVGLCWQEVGPDLVCGRPRLDRALPYSECCCLYGAAWGMDCALCPARDSDDFEFLCNALRPPPDPPRYSGPPFSPPFPPSPYGLPYAPPPLPLPYPDLPPPPRPYYPSDPLGGGAYALPPLFYEEMGDFGGAVGGGGGGGPPRSYRAPPEEEEVEEEEVEPPPGMWGAERPGGGTEDAPPPAEALPPEQCGVLSGCENGRCVRIPRGFTCICNPGFRLHRARMACIDIDECSDPSLCGGGRCLNTLGSFRCFCPPGSMLAQSPPRCIPTRPRA